MTITLVQTNLAHGSKTASLARLLADDAAQAGATPRLIDLTEHDLPLCDGTTCYADPRVQALTAEVAQSDAILLVSPIYNYDLNAAAKNFLELTNSAWTGKTVGFVLQAGGSKSFMAPMAFAASLMLDHRCTVVPRFVWVERADFVDGSLPADSPVRERLRQLARDVVTFGAVHPATQPLAT